MTDTAYGWLMRECMEKAAAGIDYGIDSRARVYEGMDLFFQGDSVLRERVSYGG